MNTLRETVWIKRYVLPGNLNWWTLRLLMRDCLHGMKTDHVEVIILNPGCRGLPGSAICPPPNFKSEEYSKARKIENSTFGRLGHTLNLNPKT